MCLNYLFNLPQLLLRQTMILCQFDGRFKPELALAIRRADMNVHARFFQRKEEESVASFSEYGWSHGS
jgi:hypothetical protein